MWVSKCFPLVSTRGFPLFFELDRTLDDCTTTFLPTGFSAFLLFLTEYLIMSGLHLLVLAARWINWPSLEHLLALLALLAHPSELLDKRGSYTRLENLICAYIASNSFPPLSYQFHTQRGLRLCAYIHTNILPPHSRIYSHNIIIFPCIYSPFAFALSYPLVLTFFNCQNSGSTSAWKSGPVRFFAFLGSNRDQDRL